MPHYKAHFNKAHSGNFSFTHKWTLLNLVAAFFGAENKLAATSSSQKSWESQEKKLEMLNQGHTKAFSQLWIIDDIGYDAPTSIHEEEKQ